MTFLNDKSACAPVQLGVTCLNRTRGFEIETERVGGCQNNELPCVRDYHTAHGPCVVPTELRTTGLLVTWPEAFLFTRVLFL